MTLIDNASPEDLKNLNAIKGNITVGANYSFGISPDGRLGVPSLDVLWNDKIDSLENVVLRMSQILEKLTVMKAEKVSLDTTKIPADLDPSLMDGLGMLAKAIE